MVVLIRKFLLVFVSIGIISIMLFSCKGNKTTNTPPSKAKQESSFNNNFPYVGVPNMITDEKEALIYYSSNFWTDYIKMEDKSIVDSISFEQAYYNYIYTLMSLQQMRGNTNTINSIEKRLISMSDSLYMIGDKSLFTGLLKYSEKYLYNPNSPMLNEELYIPILESILSCKSLDKYQKMQYEYQLKLAILNRVGTKAANFSFSYLRENGAISKNSLYNIKSDYVLLFFNNPDCSSCAQMCEELKNNQLVSNLIKDNLLKVLAIYIDEDINLWRQNRPKYPDSWIYAFDHKLLLRNNDIYGIRAIPSFYLLNKDKEVVVKDAPNPGVIIAALSDIINIEYNK